MQHKTKTEHAKQIEELSRLTGELAHEIKNPLSVIKVNLKLIREELQDADFSTSGKDTGRLEESCSKAMRKLAVIEKETDRLEQILDGFLQYVSRTEMQLTSADINEVVDDMVDFYSPQAQGRKITIRQSLCREALICRVDVNMIKQAILNLLINAQQAMSSGGELLIRTERQNKDAVIQIGDTGSGIAPDRLAHIFDGYYSSRPRGSGLGLPTTRKIIQTHKGSISVNSEQGKGTLFTIKLPVESK
jgi:signal transduction histidine kinase